MSATHAASAVHQLSAEANPAALFETLNRFRDSLALKGAIDLDLFTHIASGATTPVALAERCQASERGVRILCDFLAILGYLRKDRGHYTLTPETGPFLNRQSPFYMGSVASFLTSSTIIDKYRDIASLVRKGSPIDAAGRMEEDTAIWVEFARSMVPIIMPAALQLAAILSQPGQKQKVLDIAAGHGIFGISIAQRNPFAEIYPLDWKPVLEVAMENATRAGVRDRLHPISGSAFEQELGAGYDVVLIPNFLHHFEVTKIVTLLKRIQSSLSPDGIIATVEFVPNDDRISPPSSAGFSMTMLANTERGDAYTFNELDAMFREAGFGRNRIQPLAPTPMSLILSER